MIKVETTKKLNYDCVDTAMKLMLVPGDLEKITTLEIVVEAGQ